MAQEAAASIALRRGTLTTQWDSSVGSSHVSVWQVGAAVKIFPVVTGVAILTKHRSPDRKQWRGIRTMRRMTVGAIVDDWRMLPEERTALFRVARVARLIYRFFCQQLRSS